MQRIHIGLLVIALAGLAIAEDTVPTAQGPAGGKKTMELGSFSVSLAVKDLETSRTFYEKLGFTTFAGEAPQGWLILQNGSTTIGLFQGMFERNLLTFNPGWNHKAEALAAFEDIRDLQKRLKEGGLKLTTEADPASTGPASLTLLDPDGNPILLDQHVPKPGKPWK